MMAATLTPNLIDKDFRNWLKGALAALFAREGLLDFVENESIAHQMDLLNDACKLNRIPVGTTCNSCTTANVLVCPTTGFCYCKGKKCNVHDPKIPNSKPNQPCRYGLCTALRDVIRNEHRYGAPSWKNSDTTKWCIDAFQIAKNYMPPDGYSDKTCFAETDFNGVIAVIINNKRFEKKMSTNFSYKANICEEARKAGRKIRHAPKHQLSDTELVSFIDVFIQLLSDPKYLLADAQAMEAVEKLKQLKTNTLTISADDITSVLNDSIQATFDNQQKALMCEIDKHFQKHKADSVEAIDKKVQEFVQLANTHFDKIQSHTEKGISELKKQKEKGKTEVNVQTKRGKAELIKQTKKGINKLKTQSEKGIAALDIQCKLEKYELHSQIEKEKEDLNAHTKQMKQDLVDKSIQLYTRTVDKVTTEINAKTKIEKQVIEAHGKNVCEQINKSALLNTGNNDDKLFQDLKEDIITYYREHESVIPASPLVDEHNVPIDDLYVLPPILAYKNSYFGPSKDRQKEDETSGNDKQDKQKITISELFLTGDVRYKKIYITANAGFGKTSLSQKLTMTWCRNHLPFTSLTQTCEGEELAAIKYFDLLFLLHLRDYQSESKCNLDDLIMQMVSEKLSRNTQYTKEFVQRILHKYKCLIILDGLDEWAHPGHCTRKPEVPHNNHPDNCTVLTTTRDWKMGTIGLSPKDIDRRVELSMLDDETRSQLEISAICLLNEKGLNLVGKNNTDFDEEVKKVQIGDIIYIPYILLQLMCLFFGGLPIGKSKCEIYSNITEFTLERGLNKKDLPDIHKQPNDQASVPNCMKENASCKRYINVLINLRKLAFYTLFNEKKESSLIFDRRIVTQYMTEQEIEFCLKVGLLCQTKDNSIIAVKRYQVFFQHKSVQEFFSAIYITSEWQNKYVESIILKVCSSLLSILDMENVFVFVCGMNPVVYKFISCKLQNIVDLDIVTRRSRIDIYINDDDRRTMKSYQSMQIQCLQESARNQNESCSINLHDILIDKYSPTEEGLTTLKTIINFNKGNVKSLQLSYPNNKTAFIHSLDPDVFTSLQTLKVEESGKEPVWLADILTKSAHTLKCLTLSLGFSFMSDISIWALKEVTFLQSLYLDHVLMTHSNLISLYAYIRQATTLTQLKLWEIECLDSLHYCDVKLEIDRLNELELVELGLINMSSSAWENLLLSVGGLPLPVTVKLNKCYGPCEEEWQTIVNAIKTTPSLSLLHVLVSRNSYAYYDATLTLKNQNKKQ